MTTSETTEAPPDLEDAHWREYPVGFAGEMARAFWDTFMPFLIGLGATFALIIAIGLIGEEGLIGPAAAASLDALMRMSVAVLLAVAYLAWLGVSVAIGLRETSTSQALDCATSHSTPTAVPHPSQVHDVVTPPFGHLVVFAGWHIAFGGLSLVAAFGIMEEHPFESRMIMLVAVVMVTSMSGLIWLITRKIRPAHERRRARIAQHWTPEHEEAAWRTARAASRPTTISDPIDRTNRLKFGGRLTHLGSVLTGLALILVYGNMFIRYPQANRAPGMAEAGPRAEYEGGFAALLDWSLWIFAGCAIVSAALFLTGAVIEGAARTAERAGLRRALENSGASRPPGALLARYCERHPVRLAQVAAALGGAGLIGGTAALLLGSVEMELFRGARDSFTGLTPTAAVIAAVSVLLVATALIWNAVTNVRGQEIRDALLRRWPTLPEEKPDSEGNVEPARKGPALTPQDRQST